MTAPLAPPGTGQNVKYATIIPADRDWFFVQHVSYPSGPYALSDATTYDLPIIQRIAAWALTENREVIGLVGQFKGQPGKPAILVPATANVIGEYKHRGDFTRWENDAFKKIEEKLKKFQ